MASKGHFQTPYIYYCNDSICREFFMYYEKPAPFHVSYPIPGIFEKENEYDRELKLMQSYYPKTAMVLQEEINKECDMLEYEGSMMFDEYPDKFMIEHIANKVSQRVQDKEVQAMSLSYDHLSDLVRVLLFQEMYQRRCRRRRCRRYF